MVIKSPGAATLAGEQGNSHGRTNGGGVGVWDGWRRRESHGCSTGSMARSTSSVEEFSQARENGTREKRGDYCNPTAPEIVDAAAWSAGMIGC